MIQALLGKKINQTQKFLENGKRVPVTTISVPDNAIVQVKTQEKEKYTAVQLGFGSKKNATKAQTGHSKKANLNSVPQFLKEIKIAENADLPTTGQMVSVETVFTPGDIVDITGISKGKGFAGVVKRHNFRGGPKTHGQSDRLRAPGSIGQTTTPGRVYKGKRMAGRMGQETVTIKNLKVIDIDAVNKMLYVAGLVPGGLNTVLFVNRTGQTWKQFSPIHKVQLEAPKSEEAPQSVSEEQKEDTKPTKEEKNQKEKTKKGDTK